MKPLIRLIVLNALLATLAIRGAEAATTYSLTWNANAETDVVGYVLSWGIESGGPYSTGSQAIAGRTTTATSVANLDPTVTYYFVLQAESNTGVLSGYSGEVSTAVVPSITSQPANVMIRFGEAAMFSVAANGTSLKFQWQLSTNGGATWFDVSDGAPYSGVTTTTLTVSSGMPALNDTRYRCVATNLAGSATSNIATLTTLFGTGHRDFDGDRKADLAVYRPSTGTWYIDDSSTNDATTFVRQWGLSTDIPVSGDFDGDGKADIAVYRPATGTWWVLQSSTNYATYFAQQWGMSTDIPVSGDFDGDGKTDIAVYRPSTGTWWILQSSTGDATYLTVPWGVSSDIPVPGDFDGDGMTDIAVYRPSTGVWWILYSKTNYTTGVVRQWGLGTDMPVQGDFDGDGKTDIAVYRPSTGTWWILQSSTNFASYFAPSWGISTDTPVPGDFDGDGITDLAIYRPSTGTWWILLSSTHFTSYIAQPWGLSADVP